MNTIVDASGVMRWPVRPVLYAKRLTPGQLGVIGSVSQAGALLLVPLVVNPDAAASPRGGTIRLAFVIPFSVAQVRWRVGDEHGRGEEASCRDVTPWTYRGESGGETPISVEVPPRSADVACVEIAVRREPGATWIRDTVRIAMPAAP
jgi:hypothetical protein